MCIELKVGEMTQRKTITNEALEDMGPSLLDAVIKDMLRTQLRIITTEVAEQHKQLKEQLCTS